jgi:hypothetical protein
MGSVNSGAESNLSGLAWLACEAGHLPGEHREPTATARILFCVPVIPPFPPKPTQTPQTLSNLWLYVGTCPLSLTCFLRETDTHAVSDYFVSSHDPGIHTKADTTLHEGVLSIGRSGGTYWSQRAQGSSQTPPNSGISWPLGNSIHRSA